MPAKKWVNASLWAATAFFVSACSKKPPSCSDASVTDRVKNTLISAFSKNATLLGLKLGGSLDDGTGLTVSDALADAYDPNVKRLSCHAEFSDDRVSLQVSYLSQIDDNGTPVVLVDIAGINWNGVSPRALVPAAQQDELTLDDLARKEMNNIGGALDLYKLDVGSYPSTEQGLRALQSKPPGVASWNGPYVKTAVPSDPWNNAWTYQNPSSRSGRDYDLCSGGPSGEAKKPGDTGAICNP